MDFIQITEKLNQSQLFKIFYIGLTSSLILLVKIQQGSLGTIWRNIHGLSI